MTRYKPICALVLPKVSTRRPPQSTRGILWRASPIPELMLHSLPKTTVFYSWKLVHQKHKMILINLRLINRQICSLDIRVKHAGSKISSKSLDSDSKRDPNTAYFTTEFLLSQDCQTELPAVRWGRHCRLGRSKLSLICPLRLRLTAFKQTICLRLKKNCLEATLFQ